MRPRFRSAQVSPLPEAPQPRGATFAAPTPRTLTRIPASPIPAFRIGERAPKSPPAARAASLGMDAGTHARLTRGKLAPERRLDLHGMTLAEAHPALAGFVRASQAQGLRLVLVITGKGSRGTGDTLGSGGVLRRQVPLWLSQAPLSPLILQIAEAHARHGGSGALYLYLRRG